jgi:hypothetical protein
MVPMIVTTEVPQRQHGSSSHCLAGDTGRGGLQVKRSGLDQPSASAEPLTG